MVRLRLDPERHGSDGYTSMARVAAIGLAVAFLAISSHLALQAWYAGRVLPGVVVGDRNVGGMTLAQARQAVGAEGGNYRLRLDVAGEQYVLTPQQLGVQFDVETSVDNAYASGRNSWLMPLHHDPIPMSYTLDGRQLNAFATSVEQRVGTQPVDAGVVVKNGTLTTVADKNGYTIDRQGLEKLVQDDVRTGDGAQLQLKPRAETADIQQSDLGPTLAEARRLMATPVVLSYNGQTYTPTEAQIGQWLAFVKQPNGLGYKLVPQVATSKLTAYVKGLAGQLDVAPVNELLTVVDGTSKTNRQGVNGTAIDQAPLVSAIAAAVTKQEPLTFTITSHTVPFLTVANNLVSLNLDKYIEVNLSKQHLWVWQDHQVIYDSPITSGATGAGFPTVTGLYHVYQKRTNTHLIGYQYGPRYNYDVSVQYWMAFYEGFGLHDASWRNGNFGETSGPFGYYYDGSHGCVNLPLATAAYLYSWTVIGTPVWVHN